MDLRDDRNEIERLYQRFLLRHRAPVLGAPSDPELDMAYRRAVRLLGAEIEWTRYQHFELRLRLALHFAPQAAIAFDPRSPLSRRVLIRDYLVSAHGRSLAEAEDLSTHVARILNAFDEKRRSVREYYPELVSRQKGRCAHCNVRLLSATGNLPNPSPHSLRTEDEYKPLYLAPYELLAPEVDHIEPISRLGRNDPDNLQVLCRFCNEGKGDLLGLDLRKEALLAGNAISEIPRRFRAEMHYYVLSRDCRTCIFCSDSGSHELTVRKINIDGGYIRSNLHTVCSKCL